MSVEHVRYDSVTGASRSLVRSASVDDGVISQGCSTSDLASAFAEGWHEPLVVNPESAAVVQAFC